MKRVKINNFNIQLSLWGDKGKNLFCIHGISSNSRAWQTVAESFKKDFKITAMDLRGRGHSDAPGGYSLENHVQDMKNVMEQLGINKVVLMGHSLGAYICIMFAATYPEKVEKVILFDGGGKLSQEQAEKVFSGIKPSLERLGKVFDSFDDYIAGMKKAPFLKPWYEPLSEYYKYELENLTNGKVISKVKSETILEEIENLKNIDISQYYFKIKCPVYILRATEGMLTDSDLLLPEDAVNEMLTKIYKAKVIDIKGTNHYTILFYPNKERDDILKEIFQN